MMKVIKVIVDEAPCCCGGKPSKKDSRFYPYPCDGLAFGEDTWCIYTGKTIPNTDVKPDWCPLMTPDYGKLIEIWKKVNWTEDKSQ